MPASIEFRTMLVTHNFVFLLQEVLRDTWQFLCDWINPYYSLLRSPEYKSGWIKIGYDYCLFIVLVDVVVVVIVDNDDDDDGAINQRFENILNDVTLCLVVSHHHYCRH